MQIAITRAQPEALSAPKRVALPKPPCAHGDAESRDRLDYVPMTIWRTETTPEQLQARSRNTLAERIGIRITEIGPDYLRATMPVNSYTHQPMGILHGGASVALAETAGSLAANLCVDPDKYVCVGQEINANHPATGLGRNRDRDRAGPFTSEAAARYGASRFAMKATSSSAYRASPWQWWSRSGTSHSHAGGGQPWQMT